MLKRHGVANALRPLAHAHTTGEGRAPSLTKSWIRPWGGGGELQVDTISLARYRRQLTMTGNNPHAPASHACDYFWMTGDQDTCSSTHLPHMVYFQSLSILSSVLNSSQRKFTNTKGGGTEHVLTSAISHRGSGKKCGANQILHATNHTTPNAHPQRR